MKLFFLIATLVIGAAFPLAAEDAVAPPFKDGERLHYEVTWPSGLSLGEADFEVHARPDGWEIESSISASLPAIEIRDKYRSRTDASLCSQEFEKNSLHGARSGHESVEFDQQKQRAKRTTLKGGGISEFDIPPCARDGLAFLYYLRNDIARGRIPPPDDINFGSQYMVSVTYAETKQISIGGAMRESDRILIDLTGPNSHHTFEIFFGKDPARTPLLIRVPFELGTFSLTLVE